MQGELTALFQAQDGAAEGIQADYHQAMVLRNPWSEYSARQTHSHLGAAVLKAPLVS